MIGKIIRGKGFRGAIGYVLEKPEARLIGTNLVAERTAEDLALEMREHAALHRPGMTKPVVHVSLSAAPGEHLSDEQWRQVAESYREKMGFADCQYVLARHDDTGHEHVHLVMSRVTFDGKVVDLAHNYRRQEHALGEIERDFGLRRVREEAAQKIRENPAAALDTLLAHRSSFTESGLRTYFSRYLEDAEVTEAAARVFGNERCVLAGERDGVKHYTSREVAAEIRACRDELAELAGRRNGARDRALGAMDPDIMRLSAEQRAAVEAVTNGRHLAVVTGYAGAGKSTMLEAARREWESQGKDVIGCAIAGKAAKGLAESSGIHSDTIAKTLIDLEQGRRQFNERTVLVVDEAGMVETRQMHDLARHVRQAGGTLVLVGDERQLRPIGRGGAFGIAREVAGETSIETVRRQRLGWQREASVAFGRGDAAEALQAYVDRDRVSWAESRGSARGAVVRDYVTAVERGEKAADMLVLAHRRRDVDDLNAAIRGQLLEKGRLGEERHYSVMRGETSAEIDLAVGERIVCTKNDRAAGVRNGSFGTVLDASESGIRVRMDDGDVRDIDLTQYGHVQHGYAATVHKSQGATVERTFVLGSRGMDSNLAYVALSRHRDDTMLYAGRTDFEDAGELIEECSRSAEAELFGELGIGEREETLERTDQKRAKASAEAERKREYSSGGGLGLERGADEEVREQDRDRDHGRSR